MDRAWHKHLTVTTVPQTLLDCAAQSPLEDIRYFLAEADYHRVLDLDAVRALVGRGKPGSGRLSRAVELHWPDLARTRSKLERDFLFLVEAGGLPRPEVNVRLCGLTVDCFWPEHRVVVELDGPRGHGTQRQVSRDHGRDLTLRAAGIVVRRYGPRQIYGEAPLVLADLRSIM
jgi:very-short-patch-repair endonuclease